MKNETIMAIIVIALIAVVAIQTVQIFSMSSQKQNTYTPSGMASSNQGFDSAEEMMEAHHGSSGGTVGGC